MKQKIVFTKEEKREFDALKHFYTTLYEAFSSMNKISYPKLCERLFSVEPSIKDNLAQIEFARAWAHPDLIEVKEPRFAYKLKPNFQAFFNSPDETFLGFDNPLNEYPEYHTDKEWKRIDDDIKNMYKKVEEK